jgi:hypothetical protein
LIDSNGTDESYLHQQCTQNGLNASKRSESIHVNSPSCCRFDKGTGWKWYGPVKVCFERHLDRRRKKPIVTRQKLSLTSKWSRFQRQKWCWRREPPGWSPIERTNSPHHRREQWFNLILFDLIISYWIKILPNSSKAQCRPIWESNSGLCCDRT